MNGSEDNWNILFAVGTVIILVWRVVWRKFSLGRRLQHDADDAAQSPSDSAILSYFTAGQMLTNVRRDTINNMKYSLYMTLPMAPTGIENMPLIGGVAAIFSLDLPYNTESHIVGLGKKHKLNRLQFKSFLEGHGMEPVVLEGDFSKYFDIYAAKGQQFEVRIVMDPDAMAYVVDYCSSHFWEINNSQMYIVATSADPHTKEEESLIIQGQKFADEIKPALRAGDPGAPVVHHETPYGEYNGPALPCPICQKIMTITANYQTCPDGHGVLLNGKDLDRLHNRKLELNLDPAQGIAHDKLTCPNCHNPLIPTAYQGSRTMIDSCQNCIFRWLDSSDLPKLIRTKVDTLEMHI